MQNEVTSMYRRWNEWPLAVVVYMLVLAVSLADNGLIEPLSAAVAAVAGGACALRRINPAVALIVTLAASLYYCYLDQGELIPIGAYLVIALYDIGLTFPLRWSEISAAAVIVTCYVTAAWVDHIPRFDVRHAIVELGWFITGVTAGIARKNYLRFAAEAKNELWLAEQALKTETRYRVSQERLRISQDLHDVIGHSIAVISVNSAAAAHVLESDVKAGKRALLLINEASNSALAEIRAILEVLQSDSDGKTPTQGSLYRLDDVERLVETSRLSGVPVSLSVRGKPREVPSNIGLGVYRLVQESLTNIIKHAEQATVAEVRIAYEPNLLRVEITDNGSGDTVRSRNRAGTGLGIGGMRNRVEAIGGTLHAGPLQGRGFAVTAEIPDSWGSGP